MGRALAENLQKEGVSVSVVARRADGLPKGTRHWQADLADAAQLAALEGLIRTEAFDLIINAAGSAEIVEAERISPEEAQRAWQLMVESPRRIAAAALPELLKSNGALVNISSLAAEFPIPYLSLYNAAKAALSAQTLSLGDEHPHLQVLDVRPGDICTSFGAAWQAQGPLKKQILHLRKMMDAAPRPERVARQILRALYAGRKGTLRVGGFWQAAFLPFCARLVPESCVNFIRKKYLNA